MTATVAGEFKRGKLKLLEEPQGLRKGKVRVTLEDEPEQQRAGTTANRQASLRLPLSKRRRILNWQAAKTAMDDLRPSLRWNTVGRPPRGFWLACERSVQPHWPGLELGLWL